MPRATLSDAIQDYLREIYKLGVSGDRVTTTALARGMGVSAASTDGEQVALEVIRHHRLLELYLAQTLGIHVDEVHDEADRLEHVLSEELEARIDETLGYPTHDPHGDPIPDANLEWPQDPALRASSSKRRRA